MKLILPRDRLLQVVEAPQAPILVIHAPSGYGKTTLVRDWQQSQPVGSTTIWIPLSAGFASSRSFWSHVVQAAHRQGVLPGESAILINAALDKLEDPVVALGPLMGDHGLIVLVLDAHENLRDLADEIDDHLVRLTETFDNVQVIVTTRTSTTLLDPGHRLHGRVRVISESDLAFTPDEVGEFLRLVPTQETPGWSYEQVHRATAGYPLALRAWSLAGDIPSLVGGGDREGWGALVASDLRAQLDDATFAFASVTSVPPYFDQNLTVELVGDSDLDNCVELLEWNGYGRWIPFDSDRPVFQYVETFREIMRANFEKADPESFRRASAISAGWLHRDGQHEQAFALAVRGRDYALASRVYMSVLLSSPESYTTDYLDRELAQIPRDVFNRYSVLGMARGLALLSNPATRASGVPYFVRTAKQTGIDWRGLDGPTSFFLRVAKVSTLRWIGRYRESAAAAFEALDFYRSTDIGDNPALVELHPIGLRQMSYSLFQAGEFERAAEVASHAIGTARVPWSRNYTVVHAVGQSAIEGRSRASEHWAALVDADAWPRDHAYGFVNGLGRVGAAARALDRLDFQAALDEYDGCESFVDTADFWPFIAWTRLHAMLGLGIAGVEIHRITGALDATPPPPGIGDNFGTTMLRALLANAAIAQGNLTAAHAQINKASGWEGQLAPARALIALQSGEPTEALYLSSALEDAPGHSIRSRVFLLTVGAAAALRSGQPAAANTLLQRAGALYVEHGARAHLVFLPPDDLLGLREHAAGCGPEALAYLEGPIQSVVAEQGHTYPNLTTRELAVVRASAVHSSRVEIARALHVSPETVKSQTKGIYRKWRVNTRADLISRAIELGILVRQSLIRRRQAR